MARTPDAEPAEPTAEQLRGSWLALVARQVQGGGCLAERVRLAEAIAAVEVEMLERSWEATA